MKDEPAIKFDILARKLKKEGWFLDPEIVLAEMREIQLQEAMVATEPEVRNLRTRQLRAHLEMRQGLLFCHGMSARLGIKFFFARLEEMDFDGAAYWSDEGSDVAHFSPIQLKELPPESINPKATLEQILASLEKYGDAPNLAVGIHMNRDAELDWSKLVLPKAKFAGIYLFFATAPDQSEWAIVGDLQDKPIVTTFRHPGP